jgi:HPt (histidine-containing phosphotransfer) domain-containing protein
MEERIRVRVDPDIADLVPGYLANRERDVEAGRAALASEDFEALRVMGHGMKGSGGGYGFDRITAIGQEMEAAAIARDGEAVGQCIEALAEYLGRVDLVC